MSGRWVLDHVSVWDGERMDFLPDRRVVVEEGRIAEIATAAASHPGGDDAERPDLAGGYLVPGLVDLHVHLVWGGAADPEAERSRETPAQTLLRAAARAWESVRRGVTTVCDLGSSDDLAIPLAQAVEEGVLPGPRILAAGRALTMTGGHDPFWARAADGPWAVRAAVRGQVDKGAAILKVAASGGVYGRARDEEVGRPEFTEEELRAAVEEAHRLGRKVSAHAVGASGVRASVNAGVDLIHHGQYLDDATAADLAAYGGTYVPTIAIYRTIARGGEVPEYAAVKARAMGERHVAAIAAARRAGVRLATGSDSGSCNLPHPGLFAELGALVEAGLSPAEVLRAATRESARALCLPDGIGELAAGAAFDAVLFAQDPLRHLDDPGLPVAVWVAGRMVAHGGGRP